MIQIIREKMKGLAKPKYNKENKVRPTVKVVRHDAPPIPV